MVDSREGNITQIERQTQGTPSLVEPFNGDMLLHVTDPGVNVHLREESGDVCENHPVCTCELYRAETKKTDWVLCPVCRSKTRIKIREDTILENFPLYCPKCKQECLIEAKGLHITVIKEPDA